MNYFAHGHRFIDRPYFLVGTALPDALSVVDRKVRLRSRLVRPFADGSGSIAAEVAAGALQHLHDDDWFHNTPAFHRCTAELTARFRTLLSEAEGHHPSFLGHIVTELLLDGVLIARHPGVLEAYYAAWSSVDARSIEEAVNRMCRNATDRLAAFIPLFVRERFLFDYQDSDRLLFRLNQVMRRVKLNPLPPEVVAVLDSGRKLIDEQAGALLPGFDLPPPPREG